MMIRIRKAEWKDIDVIDQTQVDVYVLGEGKLFIVMQENNVYMLS